MNVSSTAADTESGQPGVLERLGRYDLIHRIGSGGMAEVFVARQRGPMGFEKLVVVKKIHEHLARQPSFIEMLLKEARVSALLKNQYIVDIYDLGHVDNTYFIAMEYLPGQPLTKIITTGVRKRRPLPIDDAANIVRCAAAGLDAAHNLTAMTGEQIELIHRDVSPGNIVVLYDGNVKLVDFGIAKAHGEVTNEGGPRMLKGKAGYVSPEQVETGHSDRRGDIFALGIVLWECLTLRRLFRAEDDAATLELIKAGKTRAPSYYRREVPAALDAICARALASDPDERYQHARDMQGDLDDFLRSVDYRHKARPLTSYLEELFADVIAEQRKLVRLAFAAAEPAPAAAAQDEAAANDDVAVEEAAAPVVPRASTALPLPAPTRGTGEVPALGKKAMRSQSWPALPLPLASPDDADPADDAATTVSDDGLGSSPEIEIVADYDDYDDDEVSATKIDPTRPESSSENTPPFQGAVEPAAAEFEREDQDESFGPAHGRRGWIFGGVIAAVAIIVIVVMATRGNDGADDNAAAPSERPVAAAAAEAPDHPIAAKPAPETAEPAATPETAEPAATPEAIEPAVTPEAIEPEVTPEAIEPEVTPEAAEPAATRPPRTKPAADPARAAELYREGFQAFVRGDLNKARQQLRASARADRSYAPAQRGLGLVAERKGDVRAAIRAFEKYLRMAPRASDAGTIRKRIDRLRK